MKRRRVLTVFWHSVESDSIHPEHLEGSNPTVSTFREQIRFLVGNYTPISTADFLEMMDGAHSPRTFAKPPLLLGFDDGFRNVLTNALPVLNEFHVPATLFVMGDSLKRTDFVPWFVELTFLVRTAKLRTLTCGGESVDLDDPASRSRFKRRFESAFRGCRSDSDREGLLSRLAGSLRAARPIAAELPDDLRLVDKEDLETLGGTSLLTVASHAMTHRHLASLSYGEQLAEAEESDALLRRHCPRAYCPVIAYPGGSFNADTVAVARRIYRAGFAVFLGSSHRDLYAYPRIGIEGHTVQQLVHILSPRRLNYLLPIKRFLHTAGIRRIDR